MQMIRSASPSRTRVATRPATTTWVSGIFAAASLALVAVLFGGSVLPSGDGPKLAQTGAEIAPWLIALVVIALIAGALFLILGRKKKS